MWRQGDILIQQVSAIPDGLPIQKRLVLNSSDTTGHTHAIKDRRSAKLYVGQNVATAEFFLDVTHDTAELIHPEHGTITLAKGSYRVWKQREFTASGPVRVYD